MNIKSGSFTVIAAAITIVLLILFIPLRMNLKDGGSVRYKSLVYEVTKIHQLPTETDADYEYIEGIEVKILGVTVYRKTNH